MVKLITRNACMLACMQVLRVSQQDAAVTIHFHPNRAGGAEPQRYAPPGAASFTCRFGSTKVPLFAHPQAHHLQENPSHIYAHAVTTL